MLRILKIIATLAFVLGISAATVLTINHFVSKSAQKQLAKDAYIWGYPLVAMQLSKQLFTKKGGTPVNSFKRYDDILTPSFTEVVTPNVDTLYSVAWLDLKDEPLVLKVPSVGDRYYVVQFLDAYTHAFKNVGKRATGTKEGTYLIVGPDWDGEVPAGMNKIKAPTNMVWLISRVLVNGESDLEAAREILNKITLEPLSGKFVPRFSEDPYVSPLEIETAGSYFYDLLGTALKDNPPPADQNELLKRFETLGVGADKIPALDMISKLVANIKALTMAKKGTDDRTAAETTVKESKKLQEIFTQASALAEQEIDNKIASLGTESKHGWSYNLKMGTYGDDYLLRAAVAKTGLGANVPAEAMYALAYTDSAGDPLSGARHYMIHFNKDQLPPVDAFWSLTIYDGKTRLLVSNPINRYSISDRSKQVQYNKDGSLDIYVQHEKPAKASNWLPAPKGDFYLALRMYMPQEPILTNMYDYPLVKPVVS